MPSITPFLWFDNNVPEAVAFYKSVFPNAKVEAVNDFMATFELEGQKFHALNGAPDSSSTRRSPSSSVSRPRKRWTTSGPD
jgi:predicted 3-demethylubiquinone-9 3-methyltransferase (glyoxalase superfamily)